MEIVKANIIADVNENLQTAYSETGTDLDRAIIKTLTDMSNRGLLVGTDDTQTLVSGDTTLDYPTGFRSAINIILTDGSEAAQAPLIKLAGGHNEYRKLKENDSSVSKPEWFSEFNDKFYLWPAADQAYTTLIEYRKNHAKDADNIEFTTKFENLMFAGATFWKAAAITRTVSIGIWGPIYTRDLDIAAANRKVQPSIMRG